jgi:putative lysine transport system permease protein
MSFFISVKKVLELYGDLLIHGVWITILLAVVGTSVGLVIGSLIGVYRTIPIERKESLFLRILYRIGYVLTTIYIEVFRSTPMMVQAMVIYFGFIWVTGVKLDPTPTGMVIISINTGAYMAEIVRGGIISIDKGQFEAAHSVGLTHSQTMKGIILPQAMRNIMPPVGNEFIINMKDSCVLSVISVSELFFTTKSAAGATFETFPAYFIAGVIYLILTIVVTRILRRIEKKMDGDKHYELYLDEEETQ